MGSGGDQGRDFETFTTFIQNKKSESVIFLGVGESKPLVFACSLQKPRTLKSKIESDVREICTAAVPYIIYFISNQNVAVGTRHALQAWCAEEFNTRLEIVDGQALAEQLSAPGVFWIAEQYLQVPAELFPHSSAAIDPHYNELRSQWFAENITPLNYADFFAIKRGLRKATFDNKLKVDLPKWISIMEYFLDAKTDSDLSRRSTYEICVAALRGLHNLTAKKLLVESYFDQWGEPTEPVKLRDASILLSYCSSAVLLGEFEIETVVLHNWSKRLVKSLEGAMARAPGPNSLAELLLTRAQASNLVFLKSVKPQHDIDDMFKWLSRLISVAKKAPLFPVEDFSDTLTVLTPLIGKDQRFEKLMRGVDALLEARSKGYLVAEKSRDRAVEFMKTGQTLAAIDELHRAKVRWFTGDTLKGTILALLTLSNAYLALGLVYAAKYHALGAAFLIDKTDDDDIHSYIPDAIYQLANCEYAGGEWITFSERFPLFLSAHYRHESVPDEWQNHETISRMVFYFLIVRSLGKALGGNATADLVEEQLRSLPIPTDLREEILHPELPLETYERMSVSEIMAKTAEDLWGPPFTDCGPIRVYRWKALGISWSANCNNTISEIPYVEEFIAVLQIAIADLGRTDLCLLPTNVELKVSVHDEGRFDVKEEPDNTKLVFGIVVPRAKATGLSDIQATQAEVLAVANMLLIWCSCLPDAQVQKLLNSAYKNELSAKAFLARPYWELFLEFALRSTFDSRRKDAVVNFNEQSFKLRGHKELSWNDTPGIGYTKAKAHEFIRNRYRRGLLPIRKTLERLKPGARFQQWVLKLRTEGMPDWQILLVLTNVVLNYRVNQQGQKFDSKLFKSLGNEILNREELDSDPIFPEEFLYSKEGEFVRQVTLSASASTWGLLIRRQTPDLSALKKILDVRYFQATDDVAHDELFSPN